MYARCCHGCYDKSYMCAAGKITDVTADLLIADYANNVIDDFRAMWEWRERERVCVSLMNYRVEQMILVNQLGPS